jgi:hypothetical protein
MLLADATNDTSFGATVEQIVEDAPTVATFGRASIHA